MKCKELGSQCCRDIPDSNALGWRETNGFTHNAFNQTEVFANGNHD